MHLNKEYDKYTSGINDINSEVDSIDIGDQYDRILPVLDRLIESHHNRMDASTEKENVLQISKSDNLKVAKIAGQVLTPNEDIPELQEVLDQITQTENEINALNDLKMKYQRHVSLYSKKQSMGEWLQSDITEISAKLNRVTGEIQDMK